MEKLEEKLRDWLEKQGYPLEMQVAAAFQKQGFRVMQSEYYEDPESKGMREIDVVASRQQKVGNYYVRLTFAIECKQSKEKPWVLFAGQQRLPGPARVVQRAASEGGTKLLFELYKNKELHQLSLLSLGELAAYGMTQAFTTGHDVTYTASTAVEKAAHSIAVSCDKHAMYRGSFCEIVFPVIVVDGLLFKAALQEDGTIGLASVAAGTLVSRNRFGGPPFSIIRVIGQSEIESFAETADRDTRELLAHCSRAIEGWQSKKTGGKEVNKLSDATGSARGERPPGLH